MSDGVTDRPSSREALTSKSCWAIPEVYVFIIFQTNSNIVADLYKYFVFIFFIYFVFHLCFIVTNFDHMCIFGPD